MTGSSSAAPSVSASPSPSVSIKPSTDLSAITLKDGDVPTVTVKSPWAIKKTTVKVIKEGTGPVVGDGYVQIKYVGVNGRTGETFQENFSSDALSLELPNGAIAGMTKAVKGQKVGARVLVGIAAADAYPDGQESAGILGTDSLVFFIEIVRAQAQEISGTMKQASSDLPQVTMTSDGPAVKVPAAVKKLTETKSNVLITGKGAEIAATDSLLIRYRSFTADGKVFEDAWKDIQGGSLNGTIPGFSAGLVGKTIGSRVLITIPASQAYPTGRPSPSPTLAADDQPLVYVVDVYYAAAS